MKESKAVYVTKHKIRDDQKLVYQLYGSERETRNRYDNNFSCQYDSKRNNEICTCKNVITVRKRPVMGYFSDVPKQIYAYHGSRSFTDIGVGSIKALQRRKVRRVYLPETDDRAVGSSDLSSFIFRRRRFPKASAKNSYYDHKRTSSKCIGGIFEYNTGCAINEKLSPIVQTKSGTTSPNPSFNVNNNEIGSNTVDNKFETIGTQVETYNKEETREEVDREVRPERNSEISTPEIKRTKVPEQMQKSKPTAKVSEQTQKFKYSNESVEEKKKPEVEKKLKEIDTTYSSDSLVQHVHNLEDPSDEKHSRTSFPDPMENKLEREYRRIFSTKSKDKSSYENAIPEFKSTSVLRRRFEALRRGLKKDDSSAKTKTSEITKPFVLDNIPMHKDASVTSDPPSLIARSYSNTRKYSPAVQNVEQEKTRFPPNKTERLNPRLSNNPTENENQGVRGMFKLWGKKFNFDEGDTKESCDKKQSPPTPFYDVPKKSEKEVKPKTSSKYEPAAPKKEGKKFFFFKKRSKEKNKESYKPKPKDVTAGRCEIRDGLSIKIGGTSAAVERVSKISEEDDDITRRTWLKKFMANAIESTRSVNVRWNNSMYATSSSTIFELLDTVYRNTGVALRSRSETTTEGSSFYRYNTKNEVNFAQDIEAWMVPKTVPDISVKQIPRKINSNQELKDKTIEVTISDHKWLIDKSEAFAHTIELVLRSENFRKSAHEKVSSEYLRIDIPIDFFDSTSSEDSKRNHSVSDEEVYKIVEYVTDSEIGRSRKVIKDLKEDHVTNDIEVKVSLRDSKRLHSRTFETVIKKPPTHRDVVIQGSHVNIPKRCDVISVGIITQRDLREIRKPILKIQDDLSDDESEPVMLSQKKCEFAESYLQEYYRHCPLGFDLYSTCVSDSHLRSGSEKSVPSANYQGDGCRSCPNIYDDFQTTTIVSSLEKSSNKCVNEKQCEKADCEIDTFSKKFFKKFKKKVKTECNMMEKRVLPKDSFEVLKKRKMYASGNKSQWVRMLEGDRPRSVPSSESKGAQNTMFDKCPNDCSNRKKHVSIPYCETTNNFVEKQYFKPDGIRQSKGESSCEDCKRKNSKCPKHGIVQEKLSSDIPHARTLKNLSYDKLVSPSNNSMRSKSQIGTPICQKLELPSNCGPRGSSPHCFTLQSPSHSPSCIVCLPPCSGASPSCTARSSQKSCGPCLRSTSQTDITKDCRDGLTIKNSQQISQSLSPCSSPPPCKSPAYSQKLCVAPSKEHNIPPQIKSKHSCPQTGNEQPLSKSHKISSTLEKHTVAHDSLPPCALSSPCDSTRNSFLPEKKLPAALRSNKRPKPSESPCRNELSTLLIPNRSPIRCFSPSDSISKPHKERCNSHFQLSGQGESQSPYTSPQKTQHPLSEVAMQKNSLKPRKESLLTIKRSLHQKSPSLSFKLLGPEELTPPTQESPPEATREKLLKSRKSSLGGKKFSIHDKSQILLSQKLSLNNKPSRLDSSAVDKEIFNVREKSSYSKSKTSLTYVPLLPVQPNLSPPLDPPRTPPRSPCQSVHSESENLVPRPESDTEILVKISETQTVAQLKKTTNSKPILCTTPPCNQINKNRSELLSRDEIFEQKVKEVFPWPMDNQISDDPSPKEDNSPKCPSEQCKKDCPMKISPQKNKKKMKQKQERQECLPDCLDRNLMPQLSSSDFICPAGTCIPQPGHPNPCMERPYFQEPTSLPKVSKPIKSSGNLKRNPSKKKTCAAECLAWDQTDELQGVVEVSSNERLFIKIKQQTPSTEEIRKIRREPVHIKMQDEDGQTLYERKDYTTTQRRSSVLEDMYRDSKLNRLSNTYNTSTLRLKNVGTDDQKKKDFADYRSDQSMTNLIEIQVKLRINQGDKTTEINIGNDPEKNRELNNVIGKTEPEVFVAKKATQNVLEEAPQSDINIRIIVRNLKQKHNNLDEKQCADEFTKKISDKFRSTVSTGYSDVIIDKNCEQCFSIHRATLDLSSSLDKSKTQSKISDDVPTKEYTENEPNLTLSSHSAEQLPADVTEDENFEEKSVSIKKDSHSEKFDETNTNESELPDFNDTDDQDNVLLDQNTSNENIDIVKSNHTSREEKKALLKKVFKRTATTKKSKKSVRQLRDMLKIILTDSSDNDKTANSNELLKDVTYASLKPNFFRDTDSMNNYYQFDSTLSSLSDSKAIAVYPTEESGVSESSQSGTNDASFRGCMCSKVAERLNQCKVNLACCCRPQEKAKKDEETTCNLKNDEDLLVLNYKSAEYVDVETQNSKYLSSKVNSLNVSVHSKNKSIIKTIEDIKVIERMEIKKNNTYPKPISPHNSRIRELEVNTLKHNIVINLSNKVTVHNEKPKKQSEEPNLKKDIVKRKRRSYNFDDTELANILQSYEAKKAVLEIYAEKTDDGGHLVAKLPKFAYDRESEIMKHYERIAANSYKSVCKR